MAIVDRPGLPLAVTTHAATQNEVTFGSADVRLLYDRGATGESNCESASRIDQRARHPKLTMQEYGNLWKVIEEYLFSPGQPSTPV